MFYTQISDFVYQLSTVTKRNKLALSFFVGYGTIAAFVVVSAQLFIGCVSLETISSLYFFFPALLSSVYRHQFLTSKILCVSIAKSHSKREVFVMAGSFFPEPVVEERGSFSITSRLVLG